MGIKVKATQVGYFGMQRFREGQVFEIPDEKSFSQKWMQRLDGKRKGKDPKIEEVHGDVEDESKPTGDTEVI